MTSLQLTPSAAKRIRFLAEKQAQPDLHLRLAVDSGGCSGFQYKFKLEQTAPNADDVVIEEGGAKLVIDQASLPFIDGSVVDFISDLSGESFQVKNPMADSSCGCGTSFTVKM
ncbi:MAG: iron-sulfur cluster assembly accessory protein [Alphaproteobacteria bacterium]|nr:iron-sulfur cluster assembly accessory protein [Alphaproteobacteria bacterium]